MTTSTLDIKNNISLYNSTRNFLMSYHGYSYSQLFGKKQWFLDELEQGNPAAVYEVTGRKRDWLRWKLQELAYFFELHEG